MLSAPFAYTSFFSNGIVSVLRTLYWILGTITHKSRPLPQKLRRVCTSSYAWGGGGTHRPHMHCIRRRIEKRPRGHKARVQGQAIGVPLHLVQRPVGQDADHPFRHPSPEQVAHPRHPGRVSSEQFPVPGRVMLWDPRPITQVRQAPKQGLVCITLSHPGYPSLNRPGVGEDVRRSRSPPCRCTPSYRTPPACPAA